jgi:hypothetical protein
MKSIVLLVWLLGANDGKDRLILNRHLDDLAACSAMAEEVVRQRGRDKVRYLCQQVVTENEQVDENGNPIEP